MIWNLEKNAFVSKAANFLPFCLNIWEALKRMLFLALSALHVVSLLAMRLPAELPRWPEGKRHVPSAVVSRSKEELWTVIWQQQLPRESNQQSHFQGFLDACISVQETSVLGGAAAAPAGSLNSVLPSSCIVKTVACCSPK